MLTRVVSASSRSCGSVVPVKSPVQSHRLIAVSLPAQVAKRFASSGSSKKLREYKWEMGSAAVMAFSIPIYFVFPALTNWILVFAIPPHIAIGVKHIVNDYSVYNGWIIGLIVAILVFIGLWRLTASSVGVGGLLKELFRSQ